MHRNFPRQIAADAFFGYNRDNDLKKEPKAMKDKKKKQQKKVRRPNPFLYYPLCLIAGLYCRLWLGTRFDAGAAPASSGVRGQRAFHGQAADPLVFSADGSCPEKNVLC